MKIKNKKMNQGTAFTYACTPRVYRRMGKNKKSPRLRIKCGCCNEHLDIYYDNMKDDFIEIGGVAATIEDWKKILKEVGL